MLNWTDIFLHSIARQNVHFPSPSYTILRVFATWIHAPPVVWWRHKKWLPGLDWQYIRREIDTNRLIVSLVSDHLTGDLDQCHNQKMQNICFWLKFSLVEVRWRGRLIKKYLLSLWSLGPRTWLWALTDTSGVTEQQIHRLKKLLYTVNVQKANI